MSQKASNSSGSGKGPVAPSDSMQGGEFLDQLSDYQLIN